MNKRQAKKIKMKHFNDFISTPTSCVYCIDWGLGCANGHPDVYPGNKEDHDMFCKSKYDAIVFFKRALIKEGYSIAKWRYVENPALDVHVFFNKSKNKEITIIYISEEKRYGIFSSDTFWLYSDQYNMYEHKSIKEALNAPWQHILCNKFL